MKSERRKRRVFITGMQMITPLGEDRDSSWRRILRGENGVKTSSVPWPDNSINIGAEIETKYNNKYCLEKGVEVTGGACFGFKVLKGALDDAEISIGCWDDPRNVGIILGAEPSKPILAEDFLLFKNKFHFGGETPNFSQNFCKTETTKDLYTEPSYVAQSMKEEIRIMGSAFSTPMACAASAQAVGLGYEAIVSGQLDVVLAGGYDLGVNLINFIGFGLIGAISSCRDNPSEACRPFDSHRNGFVLGDGAGMVVLESEDHAVKRGAKLYAELLSWGVSNNCYRVSDAPRDGEKMASAMIQALNAAQLDSKEIGYINAHGTSTLMNDLSETNAIKLAFGRKAYDIAISSTKSMIGHSLAAAGIIELIVTVCSLNAQKVPPTINYNYPDPECDLNYVPNSSQEREFKYALSNSFGFGGTNASILVGKIL